MTAPAPTCWPYPAKPHLCGAHALPLDGGRCALGVPEPEVQVEPVPQDPQPARSAVAQPQPPIKATHVFSPGPHVLRSECQAFGCGVAVSAATMLDLNVREAEHLAASEACRRWGVGRGHVHELWLRRALSR